MLRFLYSNKWVIGLLTGLGVVILGGGYISSLWFLRGVWEVPAPDIEFGYQYTAVVEHFFSNEGKALENLIRETVGFSPDGMSRITYAKSGSSEYVSGIPRLGSQLHATAVLRASGWEPTRIGWVVAATRGEAARLSIWRGIKQEATMALIHKLPVSPVFFFRSTKEESPLLAAYANRERGGIRGSVSIDSAEFIPQSGKSAPREYVSDEGLFVSLPTTIFKSINNDFLITLEGMLAQTFHFQKTTPSPLSWIPEGEHVYLIAKGEDAAIGTSHRGDVVGIRALASMEKEQGHRHPRKKAFALPDRSIGYEYVPGATKVHFAPAQGAIDCLPSQEYDEVLFLCGKKEAAGIASSQDVGKQLLEFMDVIAGSWGGYIPGSYPIMFQGSDKSIDIFIEDSKK